MEADSAREIPTGPEWEYEPKWDGFRCLAFRMASSWTSCPNPVKLWLGTFPEIAGSTAGLKADDSRSTAN